MVFFLLENRIFIVVEGRFAKLIRVFCMICKGVEAIIVLNDKIYMISLVTDVCVYYFR